MTVAGFTVDTAYVEQVIDDLQKITSAIVDALTDADEQSARMHSQWAGNAADAHMGAHEQWAGKAQEMSDALAAMRTTLRGVSDNHMAAVSANSRMWA